MIDSEKLGVEYDKLTKNGIGSEGVTAGQTTDYTVSDITLTFLDEANQELEIPLPKIVITKPMKGNLLGGDFLLNHKFRYDGQEFVIEV